MTHPSTFELLALHALRLRGMAEAEAVAQRFGLDPAATEEFLRDAEARGWTQHATFAGTGGWFLTDRGRAENEHQLKAELAATGRESDVWSAYHEFLPLNARLLKACTDWQLTPAADGRLLPNEHTDPARDAGVLQELGRLAQELAPLLGKLSSVLARFQGYDTRFAEALARARAGQHEWVDHTDVDSCHRVWFELHEDLVASLGIDRATQP